MVRRSGYTAHCSILCNGLNEDFMARVTVEDCLDNVDNRFQLIQIATRRARQLAKGSAQPGQPKKNNKPTVMALREIAEGLVDASILDQVPVEEPIHVEMTEAERAELDAEVGERAAMLPASERENAGEE